LKKYFLAFPLISCNVAGWATGDFHSIVFISLMAFSFSFSGGHVSIARRNSGVILCFKEKFGSRLARYVFFMLRSYYSQGRRQKNFQGRGGATEKWQKN